MNNERVVTVKPRRGDGDRELQVVLTPHRHFPNEWEVRLLDGTAIGRVSRYIGSLDRKIRMGGRDFRSPGKRRTLWKYTDMDGDGRMSGQYSRADCIRSLIQDAKRRPDPR